MRQAIKYFVDYWDGESPQNRACNKDERKTNLNHDLNNIDIDASDTDSSSDEFIQPLSQPGTEPELEIEEPLSSSPKNSTEEFEYEGEQAIEQQLEQPIDIDILLPPIEKDTFIYEYDMTVIPIPPPPVYLDHGCDIELSQSQEDDTFESSGDEEDFEVLVPEQETIISSFEDLEPYVIEQSNEEGDMVEYDGIVDLIQDRPYYISEGQLYVLQDEKWEAILDLVVWNEDYQYWAQYEGTSEEFNQIGLQNHIDLQPQVGYQQSSEHSYEVLDDSECECQCEYDNECQCVYDCMYEEFETDLTIPLLQGYECRCESQEQGWNYDEEDMVWTPNPMYGMEIDFENLHVFEDINRELLLQPRYQSHSETDETDESYETSEYTEEYLIIPEDEYDYDSNISDESDIERILCECFLDSIIESSSSSDDINININISNEVDIDSDFDDTITVSDDDDSNEAHVGEDQELTNLYNRWIVKDFDSFEEKFGFEQNQDYSLGDLFIMYHKHLNQTSRLSNYFYQYPLLSAIKIEILDVYEELIMRFLAKIIIDYEYTLREEIDDIYVCDYNGSALFELQEFVNKYLKLIGLTESSQSIMSKLMKYHKVSHIPTIYEYECDCEYNTSVQKFKLD